MAQKYPGSSRIRIRNTESNTIFLFDRQGCVVRGQLDQDPRAKRPKGRVAKHILIKKKDFNACVFIVIFYVIEFNRLTKKL